MSRSKTSLLQDHPAGVRAEARAEEKGQPGIHRAGYWPYGEAISPALAPSEGHRFTAHWREYRGTVAGASVLDGLDFMHAREYDWRLGRFLEPDPIGPSWNAYAYVLGNPVNLVDPTGLRENLLYGPNDLPVNVAMAGTTETTWDIRWTAIPGVPALGLDPRPVVQRFASPYKQNLTTSVRAAMGEAVPPPAELEVSSDYCWRCNVGELSGGFVVYTGAFVVSCTRSWITDYRWHATYYVQVVGVGFGARGSLPISGSYWDLVDNENPTGHPLGLSGPVTVSAASLAVGSGFGFTDVRLGGAHSRGPGGVASLGLTGYRMRGWSWLLWSRREFSPPLNTTISMGPVLRAPVMINGE